ncbi:MAG: hypothetical protein B7Z80_07740 [Rhodospirillales bacterium 20-64-7]|nr:MAG: hypothetical protein B7Z80_07740 [Rhodospirillales bacterium 20-64-7]
MPSCCVCYTTDPGYLLPTLVSARQARRFANPGNADIAIFSIGSDTEAARVFAKTCAAEGILFVPVKQSDVEGAGAMLARLFLDRLAPPDYDQLLYLDGDTQITGSLDPLLDADVPKRHFLAATDPMSFSLDGSNRQDRELMAYFSGIGVPPERQRSYFNSGVLRINRHGWEEIGRESWRLFQTLRPQTRYPDQDALNLAAPERRIPMSLSWNFPIFLRNARVEQMIKPRVIHYMGAPKPWHGSFPPWSAAQYAPYIDLVSQYPDLAPYLQRMSSSRKLKYVLQQRYKRVLETLSWGYGRRRRAILNYEGGLHPAPGRLALSGAVQPVKAV